MGFACPISSKPLNPLDLGIPQPARELNNLETQYEVSGPSRLGIKADGGSLPPDGISLAVTTQTSWMLQGPTDEQRLGLLMN